VGVHDVGAGHGGHEPRERAHPGALRAPAAFEDRDAGLPERGLERAEAHHRGDLHLHVGRATPAQLEDEPPGGAERQVAQDVKDLHLARGLLEVALAQPGRNRTAGVAQRNPMARSLVVKHEEKLGTSPLLNTFLFLALGWMVAGAILASMADASPVSSPAVSVP
jgi:hypothetical protein